MSNNVSPENVTKAFSAGLEVLNGAPAERCLALSGEITLAKQLLLGIVKGELAVGNPTPPAKAKPGRPKPPKVRTRRKVKGKR